MSQIIYEPYTADEAPLNENGMLEAIVKVPLNDIIYSNYEEFLDILSESVLSDALLSDISYAAVGVEDGDILISVGGYIA